jgi:hypothetical protein
MEPGLSLLATSSPERTQGAAHQAASSSQSFDSRFEDLFLRAVSEHSAGSELKREGLVRLGKLTEQNPTVSHLLTQHAEYGEQCWDIVHDPINRDKPFRDMAKGEIVWLNPRSNEIVVGKDPCAARSSRSGSSSPAVGTISDPSHHERSPSSAIHSPSSKNLSQAVTSYSGTPYSRLDCYELVVQGLKDIGVNYYGREGLQHELIQKAQREERDANAYLTGEGLIRSLGSQVFQQDLSEITHPETTAKDLMHSLEKKLQPGMILSLSTPDGGHTGVISRKEGKWTFINSGSIQHAVGNSDVNRGVAEEDLHSELAQWLERAREKGQALSLSVGRLSQNKLSRFTGPQENLKTTA